MTHTEHVVTAIAKTAAYMQVCVGEGRLDLIEALEEYLSARYICAEEVILRPAREAMHGAPVTALGDLLG